MPLSNGLISNNMRRDEYGEGADLREGTIVPDVTMVGEAVTDEAELIFLDVLQDRVEGFALRDFHLGVSPTRDLDDHVEHVVLLVSKQR